MAFLNKLLTHLITKRICDIFAQVFLNKCLQRNVSKRLNYHWKNGVSSINTVVR